MMSFVIQEGNYGKINKCITFPEMLDMVPFMTGTNDIPPLYMLYGVVVHVDTLNASFSGHYVSYVKDLQGNWFRIDDSVVIGPIVATMLSFPVVCLITFFKSCDDIHSLKDCINLVLLLLPYG